MGYHRKIASERMKQIRKLSHKHHITQSKLVMQDTYASTYHEISTQTQKSHADFMLCMANFNHMNTTIAVP